MKKFKITFDITSNDEGEIAMLLEDMFEFEEVKIENLKIEEIVDEGLPN